MGTLVRAMPQLDADAPHARRARLRLVLRSGAAGTTAQLVASSGWTCCASARSLPSSSSMPSVQATRSAGTGWHTCRWWAARPASIAACLWCVPVFVMVSGALLLDPGARNGRRAFPAQASGADRGPAGVLGRGVPDLQNASSTVRTSASAARSRRWRPATRTCSSTSSSLSPA